MGRYLARRLMHSVFVLVGVLAVVFIIGHGLGDPAKLILPIDAPDEQVRAIRVKLGLEDPFMVQFARFAAGAVTGDFGTSIALNIPAGELVISRLPATLYLTAVTMAITVAPAVVLGTFAATRPRSLADRLVTLLSLAGVSIASFWLGLVLILIVAVELQWFPSSGYGGVSYVILPALTLAVQPLGRLAQVTRSAMLDELSRMYVTTARSKGLPQQAIVYGHALKNAALPIITLSGHELASLLNGAVVVETIFAWPGVGVLLIDSITKRDLPVVEANVFMISILIMAANLLVDLAYAYANPRIVYR